jgi:hypothetical protein
MSILTKEQIENHLKIKYERVIRDLDSLNGNLKDFKESNEYNRVDKSIGFDIFGDYENTTRIISCEKEISDKKIRLQKIETYCHENNYHLHQLLFYFIFTSLFKLIEFENNFFNLKQAKDYINFLAEKLVDLKIGTPKFAEDELLKLYEFID